MRAAGVRNTRVHTTVKDDFTRHLLLRGRKVAEMHNMGVIQSGFGEPFEQAGVNRMEECKMTRWRSYNG